MDTRTDKSEYTREYTNIVNKVDHVSRLKPEYQTENWPFDVIL